MIEGIGLDLVEIARIRAAMANPRFVQRVLTPAEHALGLSAERVAGRWAAKEAVAKALREPLRWHDVEILIGERGEPLARVHGLQEGQSVHVSITHEHGMAAAVAIVERSPEASGPFLRRA